MRTDPYLNSPSVYTFTYCEKEEAENEELTPAAVRELNMLAVAAVKYHTEESPLRQKLATRRLADLLVAELFPPNWNQRQPTFYYDEELADTAGEPLHVLYYVNPHFGQIARHSLHLQHFPMTDREVDNVRRMTLFRLNSLLPRHLLKQ